MGRVDISEGGMMWKAGMDLSILERDLATMHRMINQTNNRVVREGDKLGDTFNKAAKAAAAFFTLQQGKELVDNIIRARGEVQQLEIAFTTMLQSREKASALLAESVELAAKTPFGLSDVAKGAKQLLAYGTQAEDVTKTITMLGNVAAGVSAPLNDIIYLYGTLQTQGRAYAVDIRQFAGRGIPIYAELAKVIGVGKDEVSGLVEAGKVGFPEVQKAFQNMTAEGGMFFNLMQEQSKSLTGQISNLRDQIYMMFNDVGQQGEGIFNSAIQSASYLVENYREVAKILGIMIATYGSYKAAVAIVGLTEAARLKTLGTQSALLGQNVRDELLATQLIRDRAIANQQVAISEALATKAKYQALQAEVSSLAARRQSLTLAALEKRRIMEAAAGNLYLAQQELAALSTTATARQVAAAQRKVDIATKRLDIATDQASIASQTALATSRDFHTKKVQLQTTAVAVNTTTKNVATATNAAMAASESAAAVASTRLTLSQHAQALSARLAAAGQAFLNATMLSNPIVATVAIVGGLVTAYFLLRDNTTAAERAQQAYNDTLSKSKELMQGFTQSSSELVGIINDDTQTRKAQILAFQDLQNLYKGRLSDLDLEAFKLLGVTEQQKRLNAELDNFRSIDIASRLKAVQDLIANDGKIQQTQWENFKETISDVIVMEDSRIKRKEDAVILEQMLLKETERQAEAAKIALMTDAEKLKYLGDQRMELEKQISQHENVYGLLKRNADGTIQIKNNLNAWSAQGLIFQLNTIITQINGINKAMGAKSGESRTVDIINADIKKLEEERDANAIGKKSRYDFVKGQLIKGYEDYNRDIKKLELERAAITGEVDKKELAAGKKAQKEREKLQKEQISAIEKLTEAETKATIDRMVEGDKQVAEIKSRYDKIREALIDAKITDDSKFERVNAMQKTSIDDFWYDQDTKAIEDFLNEQEKLYERFEDHKREYGLQSAKDQFKDRIDVEKSYLDVVKALYNNFEDSQNGLETTATTGRRRAMFLTRKRGAQEDTETENADWLKNALKEYSSFQQKRLQITSKYEEEIRKATEKGRQDLIGGIQAAQTKELAQVDADNLETIASTRRMFDDITLITTEAVKNQIESIEYLLQNTTLTPEQRNYLTNKLNSTKSLLGLNQQDRELQQINEAIKQTEKDLADAEKQGIKTGAVIADIQKRLNELKANKATIELDTFRRKLQQLTELGSSVSELGQSIQELAGEGSSLGQLGSALSGIGSQIGNLAKTFETIKTQGVTSFDAITAAAQFVIQTINMIISSAAQRRAAEKQFENDRLSFQYAMIDATLEEFKIRQEMQRLSFSTDWAQDMKDAIALRNESLKTYQDAFKDIDKIQAKLGQRNKVDWGKVGSSTLSGAAAGAAIGSVVPVIGTVIGAVAGAVIGFVTGIFGGKKSKDVWGSALQEWPELVMKTADGTKILNVELAKQLIANNLIDDKGKVILQNIINQAEEYKKAYEEISKIVDDVIVDLGDKLRSSLVEAFKAGEDAANVFKRTVSDIIEELISQAAYAAIFEPLVENLQKEMKDSYAIGGDMNWIDDLMRFMDGAEGAAQGFYDLLEAARNEGKNRGLDLFAPSDSGKNKGGLTVAIQSITQEQAGLLAGQFSGMRIAQLQTNTILTNGFSTFNDIADRSLNTLAKIEINTYNTVLRLDSTVIELKTLNTKIKSADNASRAIGV